MRDRNTQQLLAMTLVEPLIKKLYREVQALCNGP
jgi:hypothetical protein